MQAAAATPTPIPTPAPVERPGEGDGGFVRFGLSGVVVTAVVGIVVAVEVCSCSFMITRQLSRGKRLHLLVWCRVRYRWPGTGYEPRTR